MKMKLCILILINYFLFPLISYSQTYQTAPWLVVNQYINSEMYQQIRAEIGEPNNWKNKGIHVETDDYQGIVTLLSLHAKSKEYPTGYRHFLPFNLTFKDSKETILKKLAQFNPVVGPAGTQITLNAEDCLYMTIVSNKKELKGGINHIKFYIDVMEYYKKQDFASNGAYLKVSNDSAYQEKLTVVYNDLLHGWMNLLGPAKHKTVDGKVVINYENSPLRTTSSRNATVRVFFGENSKDIDFVSLPIWEKETSTKDIDMSQIQSVIEPINKLLVEETNAMIEEVTTFLDGSRFKPTNAWITAPPNASLPNELMDMRVLLFDEKLKNESTIQIKGYRIMGDDVITTALDVVIYKGSDAYNELIKK